MQKRICSSWVKFKGYYKSHIWCSFFTAIAVSGMLVVIIMQVYLKNEYIKFLNDKTYDTEHTLLASINKNVNFLMKEFIQIGCEAAIDGELYRLVEDYEADEGNKAVIKRSLNNALSQYTQYSQWIVDVCIVSEEGLVFQYDRYNYINGLLWNEDNKPILMEMNRKIFSLLSVDSIPRYVSSTYPITHPAIESLDLFHIGFPLIGDGKFEGVTHSVIVSFDAEVLSEFLDTVHQNSKDIAIGYITDAEGIIVFHNDQSFIGKSQESFLSKSTYQNISDTVEALGWTLNIAIDQEELLHQIDVIYDKGIIFYSLILFLIIVFLITIIKGVLRPVSEISRSILSVKQGNLCDEIEIEGQHEIWRLAIEYNKMISDLRQMNEQVVKYHQEKIISMKKQQRAEREALESQINAHFICNTLGVINYEAIEAGNNKTSILIKKLSNILRYTFDQRHQDVYMFQELAWIEQYLFLQKSRLEDVFNYHIEFEDGLENWPCRKLMLQPFVENSIKHGFEGLQVGGEIRIEGVLIEGRLRLTIEDNGVGMKPEIEELIQKIIENPIEAKHGAIGIGISNVITRMSMHYGREFVIQLETSHGVGTKFIFFLPLPVDNK